MAYSHVAVSEPDYRELNFLGKGGFGTVYKVKSNKSGQEYAMKLIPIPTNMNDRKLIDREVNILMSLSHSNIIKCFSYNILKEKKNSYMNIPSSLSNPYNYSVLSLRMELCQGDLASILENRKSIDDLWNRKIFKQIVLGVEYIHSQNIIHRDLKPANTLLKGDNVKLTDFGISKGEVFSWNAWHTSDLGTWLYMAPEVKLGKYNKTIDIYSLGMILIELYTDAKEFQKWSYSLYNNGKEIKYHTPMPHLNETGRNYVTLITNMTQEPNNRPTLSTIKKYF